MSRTTGLLVLEMWSPCEAFETISEIKTYLMNLCAASVLYSSIFPVRIYFHQHCSQCFIPIFLFQEAAAMAWVLVVLLLSGSIADARLETEVHRFETEDGCEAAKKVLYDGIAVFQRSNTDIWTKRGVPDERPHVTMWARCVVDARTQ